MDKLVLKYNASRVDEIEKAKGLPIENCIADNTINNLALMIMKGLVNEDGTVGVQRPKAIEIIDEYLVEKDKDELLFDITEALVDGGFLSRELDIAKLREKKAKYLTQANEQIDNI